MGGIKITDCGQAAENCLANLLDHLKTRPYVWVRFTGTCPGYPTTAVDVWVHEGRVGVAINTLGQEQRENEAFYPLSDAATYLEYVLTYYYGDNPYFDKKLGVVWEQP